MPQRATKRGAQRTPLAGDCQVLICGASFAGLAIARELAGSGAKVLLIDRYEIGERQTSACAAPTVWLRALGLEGTIHQTFAEMTVHTRHRVTRWRLPFSFSTFDYRELCAQLFAQSGLSEKDFETATVTGRAGNCVQTDRGELRAELIVDALGWRRVLGTGAPIQPPKARLSRGLEVHPQGSRSAMELWIDDRCIRAGYGWSFPAGEEVRVGVGSFRPRDHVREPTMRLASALDLPPEGFQGNWIPHALRAATEGDVFFVGDSAGHCLPLTAEGIRTAFYFGIACGRELRMVLDGRQERAHALARYSAFCDRHAWKYRSLLRTQRLVGALTPTRLVGWAVRAQENRAFCAWSFGHYYRIARPQTLGLPEPPDSPAHPQRASAVLSSQTA
jgi:flavin-dependent dehydrogenase